MTAAELDLDAIEARADAAGSGPWWVANLRTPTGPDLWQVSVSRTIETPDGPRDEPVCAVEYETCGFQYPHHDAQSDAAFIANARQDVPKLAAEVRRLRTEMEQVRLAAHRRDLGINAERAQWQAEVAHLRDLINQYGDDGLIPASALRKALRDGPKAGA